MQQQQREVAGHSVPEPGQAVLVRGRPAAVRDRIEHVDAATRQTFHLVDVEYLDGWDFPGEDRVVWEREWKPAILRDAGLPRGLDDLSQRPDRLDRFHAFLDALRWSSLARVPGLTTDEHELTAPWQGSVAVEGYQLWPVMKALDMPRVSLLLADDVGLGKTIQAGMVLTELMARRRIRRILIVVPASLQLQWREEMREKFSLDFTVVDRGAITETQREYGMDTNPWTVIPRAITSMDFLRQPDVLGQFLASAETLERGHELAWDALVVDEAHNVSPQGFGERSQRSQAILDVSAHFEHRVFLTATPHNGFTVSFSGLLELLDPVRFRQAAELSDRDHTHLETVMVRRLKSDLNDRAEMLDRPRPFPRREVDGREFAWAAGEQRVVDALRDYKAAGDDLIGRLPRGEQRAGRFVFSLLVKRLLSSHYAFARTWWQHVAGYAREGEVTEVDAARRRVEEETSDDVEKARREEDAVRQGASWLARHGERLSAARDRVSDALRDLGWGPEVADWEQLSTEVELPADGKWVAFETWLDEYLLADGGFREDERAILFTEYKDTHEYLLARLRTRGWDDPQVRFLFGGSSLVERDDVKTAFNDPDDPLRILVATDVAAEGLNLQTSCRYVFHWEIPWNPMRLEQRNGRVDRHGQPRDVIASHFRSAQDEDVRFLDYVVNKVHQVREDLGSVGQVIDGTVEERFATGGVDEDELDQRVAHMIELAPERADLAEATEAPTEEQTGATAEAVLHATEERLQLHPDRLARLLQVAVELDGGRLEREGAVYRLARVPPEWARLVDEHLRIRRGAQQGALPRLVFDADYFVDRYGDRQVFRPRADVALIRLGHPLITRAVARLRQRLWQPDALINRWTVAAGDVESPLVVVGALAQATNELREPLHAELLELAITAAPPHERTEVPAAPRRPLADDDLAAWRDWLADRWDGLHAAVDEHVAVSRNDLTDRLAALLDDQLDAERDRQRDLYEHRLKELSREPREREIEKLRRQVLKAEERRRQLSLLPEDNAAAAKRVRELQQQLDEKEFERLSGQRERLRQRLEAERARMFEEVLPRRFALGRFQLTPVTVELVVAEGARP